MGSVWIYQKNLVFENQRQNLGGDWKNLLPAKTFVSLGEPALAPVLSEEQ